MVKYSLRQLLFKKYRRRKLESGPCFQKIQNLLTSSLPLQKELLLYVIFYAPLLYLCEKGSLACKFLGNPLSLSLSIHSSPFQMKRKPTYLCTFVPISFHLQRLFCGIYVFFRAMHCIQFKQFLSVVVILLHQILSTSTYDLFSCSQTFSIFIAIS